MNDRDTEVTDHLFDRRPLSEFWGTWSDETTATTREAIREGAGLWKGTDAAEKAREAKAETKHDDGPK